MRPRLLSRSKIALLHEDIASGRETASLAVLAKRFGVSSRTMSRYLAADSLAASLCPTCQGSGYIRGARRAEDQR